MLKSDQGGRFRVFILGLAVTCLMHFASAIAVAQTLTESASLGHRFYSIESNGSGGLLNESGGPIPTQAGQGDLSEVYMIPPPPPIQATMEHIEVFANEAGTSFWITAISPNSNFPPMAGENVGGGATLRIGKTFRKDTQNAFVEFEITKATLSGGGPLNHPMNNIGLIGQLLFSMNTFDPLRPGTGPGLSPYQSISASVRLDGRPGDFDFQEDNLFVGGTAGGLEESFLTVSLLETKTMQVDLSDIAVGGEFSVMYIMQAEAIDTIQFDTGVLAFGRDPSDPGSGVMLNFDGVTPLGPFFVPEPGTLALLGAGGFWASRRRRSVSAA